MPVCFITFQPLTLVLHSLLYNTVHKLNGWNFEKQPAGLLRAYMLEKKWKQFDRRRSVRTSAETTRDSCQWLVCSGCDRQYVPNIFLLEGHVLLIHVALPHRCAPCGGRRPVTLCYLLITKYSLIEFPKKDQLQCLQLPKNNIYKKTSSLVDVIELQVEQMNEQSTKFFIDLRVYIYIEHRGTPWTGAMPVDGNRSCEQVPLRVGDEATSK